MQKQFEVKKEEFLKIQGALELLTVQESEKEKVAKDKQVCYYIKRKRREIKTGCPWREGLN